nr:hypothetical protein [uncultured Kingella sp.]
MLRIVIQAGGQPQMLRQGFQAAWAGLFAKVALRRAKHAICAK